MGVALTRTMRASLGVVALLITLAQGHPARAQAAPDAAAAMLQGLLLRGDASGYASAARDRRFRFPADHGPHPDYRTESWRFTGNLFAPQGRRFGFELTILRVGVVPPDTPLGPSSWAARNVYWARLSLDDAQGARRHEFARLERAARGMSGAEHSPARVWVHGWSIEAHEGGFRLQAAQDGVELELALRAAKPALTRAALRQGAADARAPFHAYALTRLEAEGRVRVGGRDLDATGLAWLDRAWGEVPLPVGAVVWDRALLQLADGRDLMVVRLRRRGGGGEPSTTGLVIEPDGSARVLQAGEVELDTGGLWRVRVPGESLALALDPILAPQRSAAGVFAWSGAVALRDDGGHGYVELAHEDAAPDRP